MSQSKSDASQKLLVSDGGQGPLPASKRIPAIALPFVSDRAKKTLDIVEKFVEEDCIPADPVFSAMVGDNPQARFSSPPKVMDDLKKKARELGLWNMFLPKNHFKEGAGFSNWNTASWLSTWAKAGLPARYDHVCDAPSAPTS